MLLFLEVIGVGGESWMASAADWDDNEVDGESLDDDDGDEDDDEDDVDELTPSPDTEDASSETSILPSFYFNKK